MGVFSGPKATVPGARMLLDAARFSPNVHPNPTDLFAWTQTALRAILTRDPSNPSPVGKTPLKMEITGNDPYTTTYNGLTWNLAPATSGQTWTVSVYVKASTTTTVELFLFGANSLGQTTSGGTYFTLAAKTAIPVTTSWTRIDHQITMNHPDITSIQIRLDGTTANGAGIINWWDGLQLERSTTPTQFNPTTNVNGQQFLDGIGGNDGSLQNFTSYDPALGGSLVFDGVSNFVDTTSPLNLGNVMTLSAWVLPATTGRRTIVGHENQTGAVQLEVGNTAGEVSVIINGVFIARTGQNVVQIGAWNHVVYTRSGTGSGTHAIYVNGTSLTLIADAANNFVNATIPPQIGRRASGSQQFNGKIARFMAYDRALTSTEVKREFNALRSRFGI
jgi:hypothetical protein